MSTKEIFTLRDSFTIIGLTGRTGSGCTRFASIISKEVKFESNHMLRTPQDIEYIDSLQDKNTVFKRKYTICYNFFKQNNKQYTTISYLSVLFLYCLHYAIFKKKINTKDELINYLCQLLAENFKKSIKKVDYEYVNTVISRTDLVDLGVDYDLVLSELNKLAWNISDSDNNVLFEIFFKGEVRTLSDKLFNLFSARDYYLGSFFVHRLGNKIRATGDPFSDAVKLKEIATTDNIYHIVSLINKIIKAWKSQQPNKTAHICIDSLRNSLEIMFLKERYAAFYMIAIHNESRCEKRILDRIIEKTVSNPNDVDTITSKVLRLDEIENNGDDFKEGHFYAPDVENCIQKSDIHMSNPGKVIDLSNKSKYQSTFYTLIEQWMKVQSLILHPGIITPSHDERCMQIAFISKFNSGCISRQVGAVVTDENNSIRSVGWNDVPKGSVPCNLRDLHDIVDPSRIDPKDLSYSPFETDNSRKGYKDGSNFSIKTKESFHSIIRQSNDLGLNHSFCFKSLHNKYEGKDNQVHTRSLHAEENAMLQVSKYGGQALKNGTLYTTASPCELCAKKAYQLGLKIVYIDPYPGISMVHILANGYGNHSTRMFTGIVGRAYNKLYEPLLSYKDELAILNPKHIYPPQKIESEVKKFIEKLLGCKIEEEIDLEKFKSQVEYLKK